GAWLRLATRLRRTCCHGDSLRLVGGELHGRLPRRAALEALIGLNLYAEDQLGDVEPDVGFHLLEQVETLEGVLLQGVALTVAAQSDALAQHVHVVEVLLPM